MTNTLKLVLLLLTTSTFLLAAARPSSMEHTSTGPKGLPEKHPCSVLSRKCFSNLKEEEILEIPSPYTRPLTVAEVDKLFADQHGRDEEVKTLSDQPLLMEQGEIEHFPKETPNTDNGVIEHLSEQSLHTEQHPQTENNVLEYFPQEHSNSENEVIEYASEQSSHFTEQRP